MEVTIQKKMIIRTYSKLILLPTFEERYEYLKLAGLVGHETFGSRRPINQAFYRSKEWLRIRNQVIIRDNGCDLALEGHDIRDLIIVHHMNPVTMADLTNHIDRVLNPEYLICTADSTHKAIHYGLEYEDPNQLHIREKGDTILWQKK